MSNFKGEKRGGFYWRNDKPYISVTKVLSVIDKPSLRWWACREVYRAMVLDPALDEQKALAAPYQVSDAAKNRGSAVHSIVEAWKTIDQVVGEDGPYKGYAQAFKNWLHDHQVTVVENERTVFSEVYGYAGTLDLLARINGDELPTLVDIKTGSDLYPEVHLQMSAYRQALSESGVEVKGTAALLLNDDGTYKYELGKDRLKAFLACKEIFEGLNEDYLSKIKEKVNKLNGKAGE